MSKKLWVFMGMAVAIIVGGAGTWAWIAAHREPTLCEEVLQNEPSITSCVETAEKVTVVVNGITLDFIKPTGNSGE
jgi:hypothetical protein